MRVHASKESKLHLELFQEFEIQGEVYIVSDLEETPDGVIYTLQR